ncbi:MAG: hypothetical protein HOP33_18035, partial [Verrucomicrobia bacterium]|nr:hypothetical protein [Verrucomicrobiota bacterium]
VQYASLNVSGGSVLSLPALRSYLKDGCAGTTLQASGAGSVLALPALTNLVAATPSVYGCAGLSVQALAGGQVLLTSLMNLDGTVYVLADGTNSVVDLSAFTNLHQGPVVLEVQNGGKILFANQIFFMTGPTIRIPPLAPILPPTLIFHGQAWHSYRIEQRNTSQPDNPWVFAARVALTNEFQAFAPSLPPDTEFRAFDFVADPAILDLWRLSGTNVQLVLYGATNKSYVVQSTNRLTGALGGWPTLTTVSMTNAFRILPPTPATEPQLFFRAKE